MEGEDPLGGGGKRCMARGKAPNVDIK